MGCITPLSGSLNEALDETPDLFGELPSQLRGQELGDAPKAQPEIDKSNADDATNAQLESGEKDKSALQLLRWRDGHQWAFVAGPAVFGIALGVVAYIGTAKTDTYLLNILQIGTAILTSVKNTEVHQQDAGKVAKSNAPIVGAQPVNPTATATPSATQTNMPSHDDADDMIYDLSADEDFAFGVKYQYGDGVHVNFKKAMRYYKMAWGGGNLRAAANIGYLYDQGLGTSNNFDLALQWYTKGALNGDAMAEFDLAVTIEDDEDGEDDEDAKNDQAKACGWIKAAKDQNLPNAIAEYAKSCPQAPVPPPTVVNQPTSDSSAN